MSGSVLIEMGQVLRAVPRPDAPVTEVAAWYVAKAALLEHVAADLRTRTDSDAAAALAAFQAARARRRAAQLQTAAHSKAIELQDAEHAGHQALVALALPSVRTAA